MRTASFILRAYVVCAAIALPVLSYFISSQSVGHRADDSAARILFGGIICFVGLSTLSVIELQKDNKREALFDVGYLVLIVLYAFIIPVSFGNSLFRLFF